MKCPNCRWEMIRSPGLDTHRVLEDGRTYSLLAHTCPKCSNVVTTEIIGGRPDDQPYQPAMRYK